MLFMTASIEDYARTEFNCTQVANNKRQCAQGIGLLKLTTERHEASRECVNAIMSETV